MVYSRKSPEVAVQLWCMTPYMISDATGIFTDRLQQQIVNDHTVISQRQFAGSKLLQFNVISILTIYRYHKSKIHMQFALTPVILYISADLTFISHYTNCFFCLECTQVPSQHSKSLWTNSWEFVTIPSGFAVLICKNIGTLWMTLPVGSPYLCSSSARCSHNLLKYSIRMEFRDKVKTKAQ